MTTATLKQDPGMKQYDAHVRKARSDPWMFNFLFLRASLRQSSPHVLHSRILDFVWTCDKARRSCVVQAPPEHGKSTQIVPYLTWRIGNDPTLKIGVVSRDADLAGEHLIKIRKILLSKIFRLIFPEISPDFKRSTKQGEWSKDKLYLENQSDPCFERYSLLGASEGHRLDLIYADDCVTRDCLYSEAARRATASALFDTFTDRLTDSGIMIVGNNCWHKADAVHQMRDSPAYSTMWIGYEGTERLKIKVHHPPKGWKKKYCQEDLRLWKQWPVKRLKERKRKNKRSFIRAFEGRAIQAEECRFPPMDQWKRYKALEKSGTMYGFLDPCGGKQAKHSDYAALLTVQRSDDGTMNVLAPLVARLSVKDQIESIFNKHGRLLKQGYGGFHKIKIEMLPKEENWIKLPFKARREELRKLKYKQWRVPFSVKHPTESKESRIERLGPLLENGWLRFPENLEELIMRDTREGHSWRLLVEQLEEWPFGGHDDAPDALAGGTAEIEKDSRGGGAFVVEI